MIDGDGFRPNVGIVLCNKKGQVFWGRRVGAEDAWQFPQGGINSKETVEDALYRELHEEVGLNESQIDVIGTTKHWLRYKLPVHLRRSDNKPVCIGQKQRWFLIALNVDDDEIDLQADDTPEFTQWRWVSYWYPTKQVVSFKQDVYRRALKELSPAYSQFISKFNKV